LILSLVNDNEQISASRNVAALYSRGTRFDSQLTVIPLYAVPSYTDITHHCLLTGSLTAMRTILREVPSPNLRQVISYADR